MKNIEILRKQKNKEDESVETETFFNAILSYKIETKLGCERVEEIDLGYIRNIDLEMITELASIIAKLQGDKLISWSLYEASMELVTEYFIN